MNMVPNTPDLKNFNETEIYLKLLFLKNGEKGEIMRIEGGRQMNQRLNDLGLTVGTIITIEREAPFGGPIQIMVRGSSLALGRGIASRIIIQRLS